MSDVKSLLKDAAIQIGSGGSAGKFHLNFSALLYTFSVVIRLSRSIYNAPFRPGENQAANPIGFGCFKR